MDDLLPGSLAEQVQQQQRKTIKKYTAEFIGTMWLVLGGCGSAVLAAGVPDVGIGWVGVSLAFGLTVFTMACAIGHISGCHLNPAVSVGLMVAGKMDKKDLAPYIISQVLGGIAGAGILYLILSGKPGFEVGGFASNGFGDHSPEKFSMVSVLITEIVLTAVFLIVICGATSKNAPGMMAPLAIGLCLTLIHLISIPVSNTSVNPARSLGTAVFQGGWALGQVWLFWVAPIIGAVIGAKIHGFLNSGEEA